MALTVLIDVNKDSAAMDRVETVDTGRRRRFSKEMKLQIVDCRGELFGTWLVCDDGAATWNIAFAVV